MESGLLTSSCDESGGPFSLTEDSMRVRLVGNSGFVSRNGILDPL